MEISACKLFENRFTTFCTYSNLKKEDPFVWREILSKDLLSTYMPAEFVWNYRNQEWDWAEITKKYEIGPFLYANKNKSWSYSHLLFEWHELIKK